VLFRIKVEKPPLRKELKQYLLYGVCHWVGAFSIAAFFPMPAPWPVYALATLLGVCVGSIVALFLLRLRPVRRSVLVTLPEALVEELSEPATYRERRRNIGRLRKEYDVPEVEAGYLLDSIIGKKLPVHVFVWSQGPLNEPES
jgi:hypothetical protein